MHYGLYSIAMKVLMQLVNGLRSVDSTTPWGFMIAQSCGLVKPPLRADEIKILLRGHTFFKVTQEQWIQKIKTYN